MINVPGSKCDIKIKLIFFSNLTEQNVFNDRILAAF